MSHSQQFWDELFSKEAAHGYSTVAYPAMDDYFLNAALRYFGDVKGKTLLDLGSGNGAASLFFAAQGANVVSVDFSAVAIENLQKFCDQEKITNIETHAMSALEIDQLPAVDFVYGSMILHHIEPFEKFVTALSCTLKPNGRAFFFENNGNNPLLMFFRDHLVGRFGIPKFGDPDEYPLTADEIELLRSKLQVTTEYPYLHMLRMANSYLHLGKLGLGPWLTKADDYLYRYKAIRPYGYRQIVYVQA